MSMKNSKLRILIHPAGKEREFGKENPEGLSCPGNVWNGYREISRVQASFQ